MSLAQRMYRRERVQIRIVSFGWGFVAGSFVATALTHWLLW